MKSRICSKCGIEKPIEEFPLRNQFTQRRQSYCLQCKSKMHVSWSERNKEYQKAHARRHTTEFRDALREYLWQYLLTLPVPRAAKLILLF